MYKPRDILGSAAEEYHIESNNTKIMVQMPAVHQISYDPQIQKLVLEAPLHIESASDRSTGQIGTGKVALPIDDQIGANSIALPIEQIETSTVTLPIFSAFASMSVEEAITSRVSTRHFGESPLPLSKLAKVLFLANGVRKNKAPNRPPIDRNVPNAGGLGSVEIYCICLNVENVDAGIYHFDSVEHELRLFKKGDFRTWLKEFVFFQYEASQPAAVLVLTSCIERLSTKYGPRGYRLGLMDVGHVSDNIYLSCTALNLNVFAFGGFVDDELNRALELEGLERCAFLCLGIGCA